ncbi:mitotic interactor and substrate of PLK1 isoform X2 [Syngnathoides biaculeatus]|uniref:mitotic interactor and substrate of PLK1 isoform X2 n=1 Tax=Syngnathoides biaculeatus TaxID=300417 RepID=UPI002ADE0186|nr:mitotic interactor and substrate of PLK1 isoform X2 [Syngnathoides biaculeatus]
MDNVPRRWVLKPLSPPLHPSDLRHITGPARGEDDALPGPEGPVVRACQVTVSQEGGDSGDERHPGSPGGSSSGSHSGFYSFVEDPTSPEAELNEAWMVCPQRQGHLTTLMEDRAFKVQTYTSGKKPETLFTDCESQYKIQPENHCQVFGEEDEKQLRMEIIQKQAPKKKSTFKLSDRVDVLEKLDWSQPTSVLTKGSGFSCSPVSLEPPQSVDAGVIDRAQIDFSAARQQFLQLERDERNVPVNPWTSRSSEKMAEEDAALSESGEGQTPPGTEQSSSVSGIPNDPDLLVAEDLSAKVLGGSLSDKDVFDNGGLQATRKGKSEVHNETPIEKDIRLVQEREEILRRSRGLKHSDEFSGMVKVYTKRVQSPLIPHKTKEKTNVSFVIQQENHKENIDHLQSPQPLKELSDPKRRFQEDVQDRRVFFSPCCPHRHAEEISSSPSTILSPSPRHGLSWTRTHSWRTNQEYTGLECRKTSAPDFIEREIEEALLREQELQVSRQSRESLESRQARESRKSGDPRASSKSGEFLSPAPLVEQASKSGIKRIDHTENSGLTATPARDFVERRARQKMDDSSYAGIPPIDDINNQVVESTRVIRHKNQRALRWEAGVFANQLDERKEQMGHRIQIQSQTYA